MVTNNRVEKRFRNKFGMSNFKFGIILLIVLIFTSCSFYTELRDNPRFNGEIIAAPESFTGIISGDSNGVVTLGWSQVEGAEKYEIYCFRGTNTSRKTESFLNKKTELIYTFEASHVKNNEPKLEISKLWSNTYYNFFIKAVSKNGTKSIFCKEYVRFYSNDSSSYGGELIFHEL